jgi:hypothetical protein
MAIIMNKIENIVSISPKEVFMLGLQGILSDKILKFVLYGMIFSYFYNLPVLKYSIKGSNEFRLYDILGLILIYYYYKHHKILNFIIKKISFLNILRKFLYWACLTMIISLLFYIINNAVVSFLQVILYIYHFWIFYIASLFLYILFLNRQVLKSVIYFMIRLSIISCIIVILQNLGMIDFLWSEIYLESYGKFFSGTLGPNKIVLGMTCLFSLGLCVGVLLSKEIKVSIVLICIAILLNLYVIVLSGSRTTYVALAVFVIFFAFRSPLKFAVFAFLFSLLFLGLITVKPELRDNIDDVLNNRIFDKTSFFKESKFDEEEDRGYDELYSDLGSGRDKLAIGNAIYLLENPQIIPFGTGFMNRFDKAPGQSAHNMYLQVIKETGLVGFVLYFGWLISYLFIRFDKFEGFSLALNGLVFAMLVALFFGEHLYIYRPLFGLLGLFLLITAIFVSGLHKLEINQEDESTT